MTDAPTTHVPNNRVGNKETVRSADEVASAKPQIIDHEARARARVAEIRAIHGDDDFSEVYVDKWFAEAPPGWTYNWKTHSVWNKEYPQYLSALQHTGWSPVPAHRVRHLLYPEYEGENVILDGMILMERPRELTDRVIQREYRRAVDVVRSSERKLSDAPAGTAPRTAFAETSPRVRGHVGPVEIDG
jgi:hypothetical protein